MFLAIKTRLSRLRKSTIFRLSLILISVFALALIITVTYANSTFANQLRAQAVSELAQRANGWSASDRPVKNEQTIIQLLRNPQKLPKNFLNDLKKHDWASFIAEDDLVQEIFNIYAQHIVFLHEFENGQILWVSKSFEESEDSIELLGGILWSAAIISLLLTFAIGIFATLIFQRRLLRVSQTLNSIALGQLSARTNLKDSKDDIGQLAQQVDITAQKLEQLLSQARNLGANIAHDLRTPLARLRARLERLEAKENDAVDDAIREVDDLSQILSTILRVARIEASHNNDHFEFLSAKDLMHSIAEIYEPVVEDAGRILSIDSKSERRFNCDRKMMVQALANLIQNAIAYGGEHIDLFSREVGSVFEIGVRDDGEGVPEGALEEIVKPMVRLDSARSSDGYGLGLSMVKAIAERHQAALAFARPQKGGFEAFFKFTNM